MGFFSFDQASCSYDVEGSSGDTVMPTIEPKWTNKTRDSESDLNVKQV